MRKFVPSEPEHSDPEFDRLLSEIFPQEVPIHFVKGIKVVYKDGSVKELTDEEIKGVQPEVGTVNHQKIAEMWENTQDVEIYINTEKLRNIVQLNVNKILGEDINGNNFLNKK